MILIVHVMKMNGGLSIIFSGVTVIIVGNGYGDPSSNLNGAVNILHIANTTG